MSNLFTNKIKNFSTPILICALFMGCATKVTRINSDSTVDLTGKWNDTDSRLVAEEMVKDALARPWIQKYDNSKTTPKVIIGEIRNMSHEHISVETFSKDIERSLLNSGKVEFVANKSERSQIRDEKADQASNASVETRKMSGEESGADLMMTGTLNTIVDQEGDKAVVFYQTNMELVEIQTHKKVWIGEKKIKKYVERSSTKF
jgi:penicillin-binding protein activator